MKKTLLSIFVAFVSLFTFAGCSLQSLEGVIKKAYEGYMSAFTPAAVDSADPEEKETYTVTFKQTGCADVVKTVKEGEALDDIPSPASRVGYTVAWDRLDFSNIVENLVVNAVETPNTYTITYDANGGTLDVQTQEVTFDSEVALAVPQREGYAFLCWYYNGGAVVDGQWTIACDVTLVAQWQDVRAGYTISFVQAGCEAKVFTVKEGDTFTEIPAPASKTGYTVAWDRTVFENVRDNITVTAIETRKTYTISFDVNGGNSETSISVTYEEAYRLPTPTHEDSSKIFEGWLYQGVEVPENGFWGLDCEGTSMELVAVWSDGEVWVGGH